MKPATSNSPKFTASTTSKNASTVTIAGTSRCSSTKWWQGLPLHARAGFEPKTLGIDTWGVDFVLLDAQEQLIGNAVAYRDERTQGIYPLADAIMNPTEVYQRTGIQRQPFNTLYQLLALKRDNPEQLEAAEHFLMIPDYLAFLLTGNMANEYTNASTTSLLNARAKDWDQKILETFGIPTHIFKDVVMAGTELGMVKPEIAAAIGYMPRRDRARNARYGQRLSGRARAR